MKKIKVKIHNAYWYIVPSELAIAFDRVAQSIASADSSGELWSALNREFDSRFGEYAVDYLNKTQLYISDEVEQSTKGGYDDYALAVYLEGRENQIETETETEYQKIGITDYMGGER